MSESGDAYLADYNVFDFTAATSWQQHWRVNMLLRNATNEPVSVCRGFRSTMLRPRTLEFDVEYRYD